MICCDTNRLPKPNIPMSMLLLKHEKQFQSIIWQTNMDIGNQPFTDDFPKLMKQSRWFSTLPDGTYLWATSEELPDAELRVYGANQTPEDAALHDPANGAQVTVPCLFGVCLSPMKLQIGII